MFLAPIPWWLRVPSDKLPYSTDPLRPLTPVPEVTGPPFSGVAGVRTSLCSDAVMTRTRIAPSRSNASKISPVRAGVKYGSDTRTNTPPMRIAASPAQLASLIHQAI